MNYYKRVDKYPILAFVIFPLIVFGIMFLMYWFLQNCLVDTEVYKGLNSTPEVLGVSTFDLSASKTKILDNETVTYTATAVTDSDNTGVVTGTIVFNLTGEGRIGENIEGPGVCVRVSELRATCTAVNVPSSKTLVWKVPVTSKSTCSQSATPTLTMVATLGTTGVASQTSEDTAVVTCTNGSTSGSGGNGGNNGNNGGTGNTGGTGTTGGTGSTGGTVKTTTSNVGLNNKDVLAIVKLHNSQVLACFMNDLIYLGLVLLALLLLSLLAYFLMRGRYSETVVKK